MPEVNSRSGLMPACVQSQAWRLASRGIIYPERPTDEDPEGIKTMPCTTGLGLALDRGDIYLG